MEGALVVVLGLATGVYLSSKMDSCMAEAERKAALERLAFPEECKKRCLALKAKAIINEAAVPQQCMCSLP